MDVAPLFGSLCTNSEAKSPFKARSTKMDAPKLSVSTNSWQLLRNLLEISLGSEIDLSVVPAASAVIVVLKNTSEAQEFADDFAKKLKLLQNLDIIRLHTGLNTSMQQIQEEYRSKLEANRKGKTKVPQAMYDRFGPYEKILKKQRRDGAGEEGGASFEHVPNSPFHVVVPESPEIARLRREK
jgi:hypothetical protein